MVLTVAVAGGSRGMGLAIIQELKKNLHLYRPLVLTRDASSVKVEELENIDLATVDYESVQSIQKALEDNNVHTVISNVFVTEGVGNSQQNLILASEASKVTKRFAPSTFDVPYTEEMAEVLYTGGFKLDIEKVLMTTQSLEWTRFHNGFFLDYFCPNIRTFLTPGKYVIDFENKLAMIPGDGNAPVTLTHTSDVAKFVVASLSLQHWPSRLYMVGDQVSWNEYVEKAEKASGSKFHREYNDLEDLKAGDLGRIKQLPGWDILYEYWPKSMVERLPSAIQWFMGSGKASMKQFEPLLNNLFPEIKTLTVDDAIASVYGSGK